MYSRLRSSRSEGARRRPLLKAAAGVLAAPLLPRFARAAEFTWRVAHSAPTNFPVHVRLIEAISTITNRSNGRMDVQVFADGALGSPVGLLAQLRAGTIDAVPSTNGMLAHDLPVAALPMVGFAFAGYDRLWPALDGDTGGFLRGQIRDRLDLVAMERSWDFGFRQVTTRGKAIMAVGDIAGLRLRTAPDADFIALFQALKALPIVMPLNALENALASRAVDGQESVLAMVNAAGLFTVQSFCALTNHVWDGQWICVSGKSWAKLPRNLKDIVAAALDESALHQRADTLADDLKIRKQLELAGMTFNPVETAGFRAMLRDSGYYAMWRKRVGEDGWTALEKYVERLT